MTILIADAAEPQRIALRTLLSGEGYRIVEAVTGPEALVALRGATSPIVALIDREMPIVEGREVCRRVSQWTDAPPIHLILLAPSHPEEPAPHPMAGAHDCIGKPLDRTHLLSRVRNGIRMLDIRQALIGREHDLKGRLKDARARLSAS